MSVASTQHKVGKGLSMSSGSRQFSSSGMNIDVVSDQNGQSRDAGTPATQETWSPRARDIMAAAASHAPQRTRRDDQGFPPSARKVRQEAGKKARPLLDFWTKLNNDWVFSFSGTLAYGLLTAIFPILLVIVAIGGFLLGAISPDARPQLENSIADAFPGGASAAGGEIVRAATRTLNNSAPALLTLGIITALIGGSGLFITMEGVFGVIFRLRSRGFLRQRLMAVGMLLLFAVLTPLILLASIVPSALLGILGIGDTNPILGFLIQALRVVTAFAFGVLLFGSIYVVVPNKPINLREAWKGTLVAAALLVAYELLFPIYESKFLRAGDYGALVGFVVVIIIYFYYVAFILLLGAEVNSWTLGQRQTAAPINAILHEVQAHNTTRGAAGPTAGQPQEDLEEHRGAEAVNAARMPTCVGAGTMELRQHPPTRTPGSGMPVPGRSHVPVAAEHQVESAMG